MDKRCGNCVYDVNGENNEPCCECINYSKWEDASKMKVIHAHKTNDSVSHPSHYNKGKIEVWDFISDWKLNFDRGNAIKYICRAGSKDPNKEIQDLEKAIEYINHEIKMLKGDAENAAEKEN